MSTDDQTTEQHGPGPRTVSYRDRPSRGSRWLIGCVALAAGGLALMLLLGVVLVIGMFGMAVAGTGLAAAGGPEAAIHERTLSGGPSAAKVAVIPVRGILVGGGVGPFEVDPRSLLEAMLKKARKDEQVRAVILAVDSGGGAITTCDIMHKLLSDFRRETGKPVVVLMGDVAASGAYYLSCAADYIMAHPTTITGSIGVMMPLYSASELLKKVGVKDQTITTGPFKDIASLTADKTPEEWERDKELLAGIMAQMYERFLEVVAKGRGLDVEAVRPLADGRILSSRQALEAGLIDSIGYMDDAVEKAERMAGISGAHVVAYGRTRWRTAARRRWPRCSSERWAAGR